MFKHLWMLVMMAIVLTNAHANVRYTRSEGTTVVASHEVEVMQLQAQPLVISGPVDTFGMDLMTPDFVNYEKGDSVAPSGPVEMLPQFSKKVVGETPREVASRIIKVDMPEKDRWFVVEEIKFLNKKVPLDVDGRFPVGAKLIVPDYRFHKGRTSVRSDMRNIHVAVIYGRPYGVHWAYMLGVRSHENPKSSRDHFAYGVMVLRGTDLRTQAKKAAQILARCTPGKGESNPTHSLMYSCGRTYCSQAGASHWANCVHLFFKDAQH